MSTDDSISEDASSSVVLSHDHTSANGGKESEASGLSSEDTVSGLALPEETAGIGRPSSAPACTISHKIRNLCLGAEEEFGSGRSLPFINPSSLETLRALMHEIQSSETDPEIWKKCEGRWLHLFQLVEKQYQEQILAQQEQYQCQIQLIQDEIKALVQLQNRQGATKTSEPPTDLLSEIPASNPALQTLTSPKVTVNPQESSEEGLVTVLSSGYGTLSTWEPTGSLPGKPEGLSAHKKEDGGVLHSVIKTQGPNNELNKPVSFNDVPHKSSSAASAQQRGQNSQPLTSWAQRQKLRQRKSKTGQIRLVHTERREESWPGGSPVEHVHDPGHTAVSYSPALLRRSDSLVSEASGLTYWKLDENELYRPLPDSFEHGSFHLVQDPTSLSQPLDDEARLSVSLREIYQNKQKGEPKGPEWDSLINSDASSPQMLTVEPGAHTRQSERTSGFTSPSRFSSPTSPVSHTSRASPRPPSEDEGSHTATTTLRPAGSSAQQRHRKPEACASLDDPVVLSLLRQNLREKHARHIADLRAYYEAEISTLKEKLDSDVLPLDLEQNNQILQERCEHLERALTEASGRIRELENKTRHLERQLVEWPERYEAAGSAVKALQQRLEETKQSSREKDSTMNKLKNRLRQLEQSVQNACRELEEREARIKNEHKMLQDLLHEYDSLRKDHEETKDSLMSAENKLFDANEEISELKRVIAKLESQVKQLEHENMARSRQASRSHLQPSEAGLFHHPDLLLSPSKRQREAESGTRNPGVTDKTGGGGRGGVSPPERESPQDEPIRRDGPLTPVMKALIQMEDIKATEGRALAKHNYTSPRLDTRRPTVAFADGTRESLLERGGAVLRAQRSLSPDGHRSSSLPPRAQRAGPPSTPTKRETLLRPLSAKSSPKRCPTENVSTAFGRPMHCQQHLHNRFDLHFDQPALSSSPPSRRNSRARLQFSPAERPEVNDQTGSRPTESSESEEREVPDPDLPPHSPEDDLALSYHARVRSLADAEKLFDELTQEKLQIEAALSRIPGAGSRVTLQTRLDQASLESRLEKVNRDLGSIRMTLKRFNILRSSANV